MTAWIKFRVLKGKFKTSWSVVYHSVIFLMRSDCFPSFSFLSYMGRSPFLFLRHVVPHTVLVDSTRAVFLGKSSQISVSFTFVGRCHF